MLIRILVATLASSCLAMLIPMYGYSFVPPDDDKLVAAALERLKAVMEKPDSAVLASLASDDLEYVHSSGTVRDKKGFINEFIKGQTKMSNIRISNQTIRIVGDNAIVRHRLMADFHVPGYPPQIDILILMVWKKEGDDWRMLARQAVKLP